METGDGDGGWRWSMERSALVCSVVLCLSAPALVLYLVNGYLLAWVADAIVASLREGIH
jgi:hypothetical protein